MIIIVHNAFVGVNPQINYFRVGTQFVNTLMAVIVVVKKVVVSMQRF